ncbi:MAG: hypothetical protein ABSD85_14885 [Acidimicrobiales bacterium]
MKVIEKPRQATTDLPDAEALIREARQRQRRRYSVFAVIVVLVIAGASTAVAIVTEAVARIRGIGQERLLHESVASGKTGRASESGRPSVRLLEVSISSPRVEAGCELR